MTIFFFIQKQMNNLKYKFPYNNWQIKKIKIVKRTYFLRSLLNIYK